jgi:hypothetical protein
VSAEQAARQTIDQLLAQAGWAVQDFKAADICAARGVAICEFVRERRWLSSPHSALGRSGMRQFALGS